MSAEVIWVDFNGAPLWQTVQKTMKQDYRLKDVFCAAEVQEDNMCCA
jgi:hypothetical protein